jgi:hypothetical protein
MNLLAVGFRYFLQLLQPSLLSFVLLFLKLKLICLNLYELLKLLGQFIVLPAVTLDCLF